MSKTPSLADELAAAADAATAPKGPSRHPKDQVVEAAIGVLQSDAVVRAMAQLKTLADSLPEGDGARAFVEALPMMAASHARMLGVQLAELRAPASNA